MVGLCPTIFFKRCDTRMNEDSNIENRLRSLIIDMDGVLWRGDQPIGDLSRVFDQIAMKDLKVVLATNNSTQTVQQYLDKLGHFGVELQKWQIITSALTTANYLSNVYPDGGAVYIIGESGLVSGLEAKRFYQPASEESNEDILAVIVGLDRELTYNKLRLATNYIQKGALFIATNHDNTLPTPEGPIPGAGAILAAVETATKKKAVMIGKPEPEMYRWAMELMGTTPSETLVIGDRLETDIAGAQSLGCLTGLVLSGVSTMEQAARWQPALHKQAQDLTSLIADL